MTAVRAEPGFARRLITGVWLKLTLLLVASLTIMSGATIAPSLPAIEAAYADRPYAAFLTRLVLTLPGLFVALTSPLVGGLADRIGRKKLMIGAIVLYAAAGTSGLYANSLPALLVGRAFLGIAVAGVMTLGTALVGDYFSGSERDRYMGLQQAFTGLGGLVFLTAGGYLAEIHWRYPFAIYAIAALVLPLAAATLREPARHYATQGKQGRTPPSRFSAIAALCLMIFMLASAFYLMPSQLPFYMQTLGFPAASQAGLAIALMTLLSAAASLSFGRIRRYTSPLAIFVAGITVMATGLAITGAGVSLATIMLGTALTGLGMGLIIPNLLSLVMALSPEEARGRISGAITASLFIGQFASPFLSQPLIATWGYQVAFWAGAAFLCLALIPGASAAIAKTD